MMHIRDAPRHWELLENLYLGIRIQSYHLPPECTFLLFSFYLLAGHFDKPFLLSVYCSPEVLLTSEVLVLKGPQFMTSSSLIYYTVVFKSEEKCMEMQIKLKRDTGR